VTTLDDGAPIETRGDPLDQKAWDVVAARIADANALAARRSPYAAVEHYVAADLALAQRLHDDGLVFAVNVLVLHPLGLALGVSVSEFDAETMRGRVTALILHATAQDEKIEYEGDVIERGLSKLAAAGHDGLRQACLRSTRGET
jgi:hypothetical protein